jgi:arginase
LSPSFYAIANKTLIMSSLNIISVPSELGAGTRGSSLGVAALQIAAYNSKSTTFSQFPFIEIATKNNLVLKDILTPYAKQIEAIVDISKLLRDQISLVVEKGKFPLTLCGDHSSTAAVLAGIKSAHPDKKLGVVWIDAHADLHSPYTTPSGNMHGMPLAIALGEDNLENKTNDPVEITKKQWEELKNLSGSTPIINYENLVYIALRDTEEQEESKIIKNKVKVFEVDEVRKKGAETIAQETLNYLSQCDIIHISFDVDSMDCDLVSYGTGTPVPNGITEKEASTMINLMLLDKKVISFDVVEINPCLDNKGNVMAETALRIIENAVPIITKR